MYQFTNTEETKYRKKHARTCTYNSASPPPSLPRSIVPSLFALALALCSYSCRCSADFCSKWVAHVSSTKLLRNFLGDAEQCAPSIARVTGGRPVCEITLFTAWPSFDSSKSLTSAWKHSWKFSSIGLCALSTIFFSKLGQVGNNCCSLRTAFFFGGECCNTKQA